MRKTPCMGFIFALRNWLVSSSGGAADVLFAREELRGARVLLRIRIGIAALLIVSGLSTPNRGSYMLTNLIFAFTYSLTVAVEFYLHRRENLPALRRYAFFSVVADQAIFAFWIVHYYYTDGNGNFNYALKSPYMVLLLLPMLTTLLQYRLTLLLVSLAIYILVILLFLGFALLSQVPQSDSWQRYFLGDTIILPAWIGLWLPLSILYASIIGYSIIRSRRIATEIGLAERRSEQLARNISPTVAQQILRSNDLQPLQGSRKQVAVLFTDIRSHSIINENLPADEITNILTRLSELLSSAVLRFNGTMEKCMGNALIAVFGTPTSGGSYTLDIANAVQCALALLQAIGQFNAERSAAGKDPVRIGIGIHAGEVFAGAISRMDSFEYAVIGDVVNTASRIAHLCKKVEANFLVSEIVARELAELAITERVGVLNFRNRGKALGIYRLNWKATKEF